MSAATSSVCVSFKPKLTKFCSPLASFFEYFAEIIAGAAGISLSLLVLPLITLTVQKAILTFDNLTFFFLERLMEIHLDLLQSCNQASLPVILNSTSTDTSSPLQKSEIWSSFLSELKKKKKKESFPRYLLSLRLDREAFLNYPAQNIDSSEAAR